MSQKLNLDFADNQPFSLENFNAINLLIIVISLFITAYTIVAYKTKTDEYTKLQDHLAQIQPKKYQDLPIKNLEKISGAELKQIDDAVTDLSIPWKQLLEGLGQVEMRDVALLSLEPSKKKQQLVLGGQAKNMQAALNYIEALEKLPMLSQVFLQKHSVDQLDPFKPVAFTIVAKWS
jgi:hypothetical protein